MNQYMGLVHNLILNKMENGELNFESKEALKNVLREYEIHTKIIEEQLEMCKKDHAELRQEMSRLVQENRDLYDRLRTSSEDAFHRPEKRPAIESSEAVENLQQQLALALEEKDTLEALWKSSVQEVDSLKEKLKEYQSGKELMLTQSKLNEVQKDYTEAIQILENKQDMLKSENDQLSVKSQFLEEQLKQVTSQIGLATEKNISLNSSLKEAINNEQELKSKYLDLEAKFIDIDRAYQADKVKYAQIHEYEKVESDLREKLESALRQRDELQTALERCHERSAELLRNTAADRSKVEEAVALVEGACRERDAALAHEKASAEEAKILKEELERLVDEAGRRVVQEEAQLRKQFDSQLVAVKDQLEVVEQERNRKRVEVEQLQKECERLQSLVTEAQKSVGSDKKDKQLDKVYKELHSSENECEHLRLENEALKEALGQLEERCNRNSQRRQKLKNELHKLVKDTQFYQQELALSEQKADLLNGQLQMTSLDLAQLQSKTILNRGGGAGVEPQVSLTNTLELCRKLNDSYGQMNDKWKKEMNTLTDKFEAKLKKSNKKNHVRSNKENAGKKKSSG